MKKWMTLLLAALLACSAMTCSAALAEGIPLVLGESAALTDGAEWAITQGEELAVLDGSRLTAIGQGDITVAATINGEKTEETFTVTPYTRVCGAALETVYPGPVAVWVDFNASTNAITRVNVVGEGHPAVQAAYGDAFLAEAKTAQQYVGLSAGDMLALADDTAVALAVQDACARFVTPSSMTIRYYQSLMTNRYMANLPYVADLTDNITVDCAVVASYPEGAAVVEHNDVMSGEKVAWAKGVCSTAIAYGEKSCTIDVNAVMGVQAGIAVVEYAYNGSTILDAVEIYDNFTLDANVTSAGKDAYGKVVSTAAADGVVTYRTLGDKAMNFPGGTCGSTVIDLTIDVATRKIVSCVIVAHSDSTYLSHSWEYGGGFAAVGGYLFDIDRFTGKLAGHSADDAITAYTLSTKEVPGGLPVDGGVDMLVTGATRTPNAIIYAVDAALTQFQADYPAK